MRSIANAIFFSLLIAAAVVAEEPASVAIHSRRVLDVRSGAAAEGYVVVRGDRIVSVDRSAPSGVRVIELGDATVLPGLIDCHVHLEADWNDFSATSNLRRSSAEKTLDGLQNAQTYLQRGFTTVRDAGTTDPAYDTIALRNAFARGKLPGRGSSRRGFRSPSPEGTPISTRWRQTFPWSNCPTSPIRPIRCGWPFATTFATASTGSS